MLDSTCLLAASVLIAWVLVAICYMYFYICVHLTSRLDAGGNQQGLTRHSPLQRRFVDLSSPETPSRFLGHDRILQALQKHVQQAVLVGGRLVGAIQ